MNKRKLKGKELLITESVTSSRMQLLDDAQRKHGVRNVSTSDGRVIVKENDKIPYIKAKWKSGCKLLWQKFVLALKTVCWVYLKEVCFLRGCFYLVFILQNFGSLAPLIFFKQLFFIKIYFLSYETLHIFCFYKHTSFSRMLTFFLLK